MWGCQLILPRYKVWRVSVLTVHNEGDNDNEGPNSHRPYAYRSETWKIFPIFRCTFILKFTWYLLESILPYLSQTFIEGGTCGSVIFQEIIVIFTAPTHLPSRPFLVQFWAEKIWFFRHSHDKFTKWIKILYSPVLFMRCF